MEKHTIFEMDEEEVDFIENKLEEYDDQHIKTNLQGKINLGIKVDDELAGGVVSCMSCYKILYVETLYVNEKYRRKGIARKIMKELESRAKILGANMIRLDTFDWQGKEFYESIGYEIVGSYRNEEDDFSEYFFVKRL